MLRPVIAGVAGEIIAVEVLDPGEGYDPLRLKIEDDESNGHATGNVYLKDDGGIDFIQMTGFGDNYFDSSAVIEGGGGSGASAEAFIDLGVITNIDLISGGGGYQGTPSVIFTRDTDLIRTARNRQSLNSVLYNLSGILTNVDSNDTTVHIETTDPYPGSGKFLVGREVIRYTGKTATSFTGCDRGVNFRFDQKVILDSLQAVSYTHLTLPTICSV